MMRNILEKSAIAAVFALLAYDIYEQWKQQPSPLEDSLTVSQREYACKRINRFLLYDEKPLEQSAALLDDALIVDQAPCPSGILLARSAIVTHDKNRDRFFQTALSVQ